MPIELETYTIECKHCGKEVEFTTGEIDGLDADIENEIDDAASEERRQVEREFEGMIDPTDHPIQPRTMRELSEAIRTGDRETAEILLDRVADDLGMEHTNAVQLGRYSPKVTS